MHCTWRPSMIPSSRPLKPNYCKTYTRSNVIDISVNFDDIITSKTSIEDLELELNILRIFNKSFSKFNFDLFAGLNSQRSNILAIAATKGNFHLVTHIIKNRLIETYPDEGMNIGNKYGWTPLFCVAYFCYDHSKALRTARELIRAGADVNIASSGNTREQRNCRPKRIRDGRTPLWAAAKITQNIALVKYLLVKGALEYSHDRSKAVNKTIKKAEILATNERIFLAGYFKKENYNSRLKILPPEIIRLILEFVRN